MSATARTSLKTDRVNQREYWVGWEEHKAGGDRPDASRPFAQQGWDAWLVWLVRKQDVGRAKLLERVRINVSRAGVEPGVTLKRSPIDGGSQARTAADHPQAAARRARATRLVEGSACGSKRNHCGLHRRI